MPLRLDQDMDLILPRDAMAVIFDVDGTLLDTNEQRTRSWQRACERHGLEISKEKYMQVSACSGVSRVVS